MIQIPIYQNKSSKFKQEIILGGRALNITLKWNTRCECWFMDLLDTDSNDMLHSIKLVDNWLLIDQYKADFPNLDGDFLVKKIKTDDTEITYDNLGDGFYLFYITEIEAVAWGDYYGVR